MFILVLILKWLYASLVGAEAGEVKFSPNLSIRGGVHGPRTSGRLFGGAVLQLTY